ncbi:PPE family protein [Mycobacterium kansasii]|uniref:PPE family protein n=1 Tax=Mycobacterium kansasii TaxID=1768 RepID=A0A1V3XF08_MYCKA|nr:PPE family protein [Mycobacterium kansasii]
MSFSVLPPEINSARIFAGAGADPLLAAATTWGGLAEELESAATSFGSVTAGLVGGSWVGPASEAMLAAAAPYAGWLSASATQARQAATQAGALLAEFEAVQAAMVQPIMVAANRGDLVSLVLSNLFGQNAPAIASVEAAYEAMWAQDVAAMSAYHAGASAVISALTPFTKPLQGLAGLPDHLASAAAAAAAGTPFSLGFGNLGGATSATGTSAPATSATEIWAATILVLGILVVTISVREIWVAATSVSGMPAASTSGWPIPVVITLDMRIPVATISGSGSPAPVRSVSAR